MHTVDCHRRSIRLHGWDYASHGAYFVTLVTYRRDVLFGDVIDGAVALSVYGRIAAEEWMRTAEVRSNVEIDAFVVMPNHVHGVVWITGPDVAGRPDDGARHRLAPSGGGGGAGVAAGSLGAIVGGYKSVVARRINGLRGTPGEPVWQRNYYERIVRNERELVAIRRYIEENPANWAADGENRAGS